jgi:hypothetical protein
VANWCLRSSGSLGGFFAWLPGLEAELLLFPGSRHDDQIDSISQALNHDNSLWIWEKL